MIFDRIEIIAQIVKFICFFESPGSLPALFCGSFPLEILLLMCCVCVVIIICVFCSCSVIALFACCVFVMLVM